MAIDLSRFRQTFFEESFEGVTLKEPVMESGSGPSWSPRPPRGWTTNREEMTGGGIEEWRSWSFASKEFWVRASGDQGRGGFTLGDGVVAIADSDEWHDAPTELGEEGGFLALMTTPEISLERAAPGSLRLAFDSSWMPDEPMAARVRARFDTGEEVLVLEWRSEEGHDDYKADAISERVRVPVESPEGAGSMRLVFELGEANNDWFWAIDDILVFATAE